MDVPRKKIGISLGPREKRMLLYLGVVLAFAGWKLIPRPWHPTIRQETPHHLIESTATAEQTGEIARNLEILYGAYSNQFGVMPEFQREHPRLKVKLFKDRDELRRINPGLGWAEAFYLKPYCRAYFSADENNPYHWMIHEAVHQLNQEVAHLKLEKWIEEGIADYYGTSRFSSNSMALGRLDPDTYPTWWLDELATGSTLEESVRNQSVIPLRSIITNSGGPRMSTHVNLYYLHWLTLTHFVFEDPKHQSQSIALVREGGEIRAFERLIGPVDQIEREWHAYVRAMKTNLASPPNLPGVRNKSRTETEGERPSRP